VTLDRGLEPDKISLPEIVASSIESHGENVAPFASLLHFRPGSALHDWATTHAFG